MQRRRRRTTRTRGGDLCHRQRDVFALVKLLKVCAIAKDLCRASAVHSHLLRTHLLQQSPHLASSLIHAYARCGELSEAQRVLEELPVRGLVCWSALISGHIHHGRFRRALDWFDRMRGEGLQPDAFVFTSALKACGCIGDVERGEMLHQEIACRGLLEEIAELGNALVHMYAQCGALAEAKEVLEGLPARNVVTWSSLIAGYALQQGQALGALECFMRMQQEGIPPNEITFACVLKACGSIRAFDVGRHVHGEISARGFLHTNPVLGNALIDMYSKCGALANARQAFDELPSRDVVAWNTLISGYVEEGRCHEALCCFARMRWGSGVFPDEITLACILKGCGHMRALSNGKRIHVEILGSGMAHESTMLGNALVDMYAKCGRLMRARQVLQELPVRDVVSWSALIAGYAELGRGHEALECFAQMQREENGIPPNAATFVSILKACGSIGASEMGGRIHEQISNQRLLEGNTVLGNALVDMYAKCGMIREAQQVFEELRIRNVVTWSSLIAGYALRGQGYEALDCFARMQAEGVPPNEATFVSVLEACGSIEDADEGEQVENMIVVGKLLEQSNVLGPALVDMYGRCGMLAKAKRVLERLCVRDTSAWNAIISGHVQHEEAHESLCCFEQMQTEGASPNEVTFVYVLKACGHIGAIDRGEEIHDEILRRGLLAGNIILRTALADMYARCGELVRAFEVLEELPTKDTCSWNVLISGYVGSGQAHEALDCFRRLQGEGLSPDEITFSCVLRACGNVGALDEGRQAHADIDSQGLLQEKKNPRLGAALVGMYARCGMLAKALQVLQELSVRDVVAWNTLITAFARAGRCEEVLGCFGAMVAEESLIPNAVTFTGVLNACRHLGKSDQAQLHYESMSEKYGIVPGLEHHTCMVMVFGDGGRFDEAMLVIETMHSCDHPSVWLALLGACRKWGHAKLGRLAFHQAVQYGVDDAECMGGEDRSWFLRL